MKNLLAAGIAAAVLGVMVPTATAQEVPPPPTLFSVGQLGDGIYEPGEEATWTFQVSQDVFDVVFEFSGPATLSLITTCGSGIGMKPCPLGRHLKCINS